MTAIIEDAMLQTRRLGSDLMAIRAHLLDLCHVVGDTVSMTGEPLEKESVDVDELSRAIVGTLACLQSTEGTYRALRVAVGLEDAEDEGSVGANGGAP